MKEIFEFENMDLYKKSIDFIDAVFEITKSFPKSELYGLVNQFRRCSASIALNIAEGYGRFHKKDKIKFYRYARSSVFECIPILTISKRRSYIDISKFNELYSNCFNLSQMIAGLIRSVEKRESKLLFLIQLFVARIH